MTGKILDTSTSSTVASEFVKLNLYICIFIVSLQFIDYYTMTSVYSMPYVGAMIGRHNKRPNRLILKLYISTMSNPTITIPDYTFDRHLFISRPGRERALEMKRLICAYLTSTGYTRWDIRNNNDSYSVDIFEYSEEMIDNLNEYLYEQNINLNNQIRGCPVCGRNINIDDDIIVCRNDTEDEHATCCAGRIHERCIDAYLQQHPNVSRNIDSDNWRCAVCRNQR